MITKAALSAASMKHSVTQRQVIREQGILQALDEPSMGLLATIDNSNRGQAPGQGQASGLAPRQGSGVGRAELPSLSSSFSSRHIPLRATSISPTSAAAAAAAANASSSAPGPGLDSPVAGKKSPKKGLSVRMLPVMLDDGQGLAPGPGFAQGLELAQEATLHDELSRSSKSRSSKGSSKEPSLSAVVEVEEKETSHHAIEAFSSRGSPLTAPSISVTDMSEQGQHPDHASYSSSMSLVDPSYMPSHMPDRDISSPNLMEMNVDHAFQARAPGDPTPLDVSSYINPFNTPY